jgi:hypothetical protein
LRHRTSVAYKKQILAAMASSQIASLRTTCFVSKDAALQRHLTPAKYALSLQELPADLNHQPGGSQEDAAAQQVRGQFNLVASSSPSHFHQLNGCCRGRESLI